MCEEVLKGLSVVLHWFRNWPSFVNQSQRLISKAKPKSCNYHQPSPEGGTYPESRAFLSGKSFSMYKAVSRFSDILCSWLGLHPREVPNKPTMRSTRDLNNFVHAKILVIKKCSACRVGGPKARKGALLSCL